MTITFYHDVKSAKKIETRATANEANVSYEQLIREEEQRKFSTQH
jgi:hypothetical protein